ncbi:MAG TPA: cyclodeaminase/cyclohydrolase family protein [Conexibacter sp.]|nr:cyclodeaminase/cyclohydrolase family protein [Conexibacter sp.]
MADLSKQPLEDFLASVADATPAPGGGSSAGVAAALAAALVEMAAALPSSRAGGATGGNAPAGGASPSRAAEQAGALRARALRLAQEELTSYAPVLKARDERERSLALAAASEPPAQIAETAAEVAELGAEVALSASAAVRGDALTGVVLAEAAASAAFRLVEINVGSGPVFERARQAELRAVSARASGTGRPPPTPHAPTPN